MQKFFKELTWRIDYNWQCCNQMKKYDTFCRSFEASITHAQYDIALDAIPQGKVTHCCCRTVN